MSKIRNCTWKDCKNEGKHEQKDKFGNVWSLLCDEHEAEQQKGLDNLSEEDSEKRKKNIGKMLSNWIKANGGADKMSKKI
jgi:hypothetical protein